MRFEVEMTLSGLIVDATLLAASIIKGSGQVKERWAEDSLVGAFDGATEYAGSYSIARGSALRERACEIDEGA